MNQTGIINITDRISSKIKNPLLTFWRQFLLTMRMCQLWSLTQFYCFNRTGFCSYMSKCHFKVCLKHRGILPIRNVKCLLYQFEIYLKCKNLDIFLCGFAKLMPLCNQPVITCFAKNIIKIMKVSVKRDFYLTTSILLGSRNNQIKG